MSERRRHQSRSRSRSRSRNRPPLLRANSSNQSISLSLSANSERQTKKSVSYSENDYDFEIPTVAATLDHTLPQEYFKNDLLAIVKTLRISKWHRLPLIVSSDLQIKRISGALTNAIYKIDPPSVVILKNYDLHNIYFPPLLLRIYGPNVDTIIDRENELKVLIRLSRQHIGPKLLGIFVNGRVEQYLENAITLTKPDIMNLKTSARIARRMKELHVGIKLTPEERKQGPSSIKNILNWTGQIDELIKSGKIKLDESQVLKTKDWNTFKLAIDKYIKWIKEKHNNDFSDKLVFCHNDTQYGNLLFSTSPIHRSKLVSQNYSKLPLYQSTSTSNIIQNALNSASQSPMLQPIQSSIHSPISYASLNQSPLLQPSDSPVLHPVGQAPNSSSSLVTDFSSLSLENISEQIKPSVQEKRQDQNLVVIDFEYSGANLPEYDISNHFSEWMHNYHHPTQSYAVNTDDYPSIEEQSNLIYSYVLYNNPDVTSLEKLEKQAKLLYNGIINWRPAVSLLWALWAILQNGTAENEQTEEQRIIEGPNGEQYKIIQGDNAEDEEADADVIVEEGDSSDVDSFEYLKYAKEKLEVFWGDMIQLKIWEDEDVLENVSDFKYLNIKYFDIKN